MSIFTFNLNPSEAFSTLQEIKNLIQLKTSLTPESLSACFDYKGHHLALKVSSDEDVQKLKEICNNNQISLLFTPKLEQFHLIHKLEALGLGPRCESDFIILETKGVSNGETVNKLQSIEKEWTVKVIGNADGIMFKCVDGDFFGVLGKVSEDQGKFSLKAQVYAGNASGWSSSYWRAVNYGVPFGPGLWIEVNVV